ncbi:MAG TPA: NAD(P)/FAD-dependent oxidoreductase [Williamwhitmania sp.]|nr:NAD(P)/FAD-dependent oxidoreductase [Williamwhitmania sp.]
MERYDVIVVGGGPAGLLAAGAAGSLGANVVLLEKMEKPARKLRITGKGRCNITNARPIPEILRKIYPSPNFFKPALYEFSNEAVVNLLNDYGVKTYVDRGERVFPESEKAWDVAEGLIKWAKQQSVEIRCHAKVTEVAESSEGYQLTVEQQGVKVTLSCKSLVMATGGLSYPATGCTGDGYNFASNLGHSICPLHPSLVPLVMGHQPGVLLEKTHLKNVELTLWVNNKKVDKEFGELEVLDGKLAGPITLRLSRTAVEAIEGGSPVRFTIDLKPALSEEQLANRLARELANPANRTAEGVLRTLLPLAMLTPMGELLGFEFSKPTNSINTKEQKKLLRMLKEYPLEIVGYGGYSEAIVTAGGVELKEVNSKTMESKLHAGLFFAGELLNLDADTGGYNLQIAFSTGYLAGKHAAEKAKASRDNG